MILAVFSNLGDSVDDYLANWIYKTAKTWSHEISCDGYLLNPSAWGFFFCFVLFGCVFFFVVFGSGWLVLMPVQIWAELQLSIRAGWLLCWSSSCFSQVNLVNTIIFQSVLLKLNHQAEVSCAVTYACQWFLTGAVLAFSWQSLRSCPCGCSRTGVFKPWLCLFFY